MKTSGIRWLAASLLLLAACEGASSPGTAGELGEGSFTYECIDLGDIGCRDADYDGADLPSSIAVGSMFDLQFHGEDTARIISGSEAMVETQETGFWARQPGMAAMMAEATADGRIIDFVHLNLADLGDIAIDGPGTNGEQILAVSTHWDWRASPLSENGNEMAGTLVCNWTSSDTNVVMLSQGVPSNRAMVYGQGPGKATVTVSVGSVSRSFHVVVE